MRLEYLENKGKKWRVVIVTTLIFAVVFWFVLPKILNATISLYTREGIEKKTVEMFGDKKFDDILVDELMLVTFSYNARQPRIFSKYPSNRPENIYDVSLADASQASAAAPTYFNPKVIGNEVLIDGGVIANDPSFLAYLRSHYLYHMDNIRVFSIGTGQAIPKNISDPEDVNVLTWLNNMETLLMNAEINTHEFTITKMLQAKDYHRFQYYFEEALPMDNVGKTNLGKLEDAANEMIKNYGT